MEKELQKLENAIGLDWKEVGIESINYHERTAALLLLMIHKGFNDGVWGNKLMRYWDAFRGQAELATGADTLAEFASRMADGMGASIGRNAHQREIAVKLAWVSDQGAVLDVLRRELDMLVTLTRVMQSTIKKQYDNNDEEIIQ
jgi:hypothetical protein